jgi:hypothetical protein
VHPLHIASGLSNAFNLDAQWGEDDCSPKRGEDSWSAEGVVVREQRVGGHARIIDSARVVPESSLWEETCEKQRDGP